jgi:hypothetical protein
MPTTIASFDAGAGTSGVFSASAGAAGAAGSGAGAVGEPVPPHADMEIAITETNRITITSLIAFMVVPPSFL